MKKTQWIVAAIAAGYVALCTGCVTLDEHRQLQMSHRKLAGEKEQLELDLFDARKNNDNLRTRLASCEEQTVTKDQLVANLSAENDRLEEAVAAAQRIVDELTAKYVPGDIRIDYRESQKLPAELDTALKDFAAKFPNSVYYDPQRGIVKWTSDLLFALGSDVVKESAVGSLKGFAEILNSPAAAGFEALVVGHTDNMRISRAETRQKHPTNWHLSVHRAISVGNALQGSGVPATRIGVVGFGEYRPIASNDSETGRSQNRRVEIYIVKAGLVGGMPAGSAPAPAAEAPAPADDDGVK